jgi:hypothetical protein
MSLKSSNRARRPEGNPKLAAAIARCPGRPTPEQRATLRRRLMAAPLLIAIHDLPEGIAASPEGETTVRFLQEDRGEDERVLCGFTSPESLAAKAPTAVGLSIDPATLLDWLIAGGFEGLLLDPAGPSAFVSHDDAREILGLPRRADGGHRATVRPESEQVVHDGLERLLSEAGAHRLAIVREATTGKSLRFERGDGDTLQMVLPADSLAIDERERAEVLFEEFAGGADDLPPLDEPADGKPDTDFVALFSGDLVRPTRAAGKVFTWVFGFPPGFRLEIDLDGR